MKTGLRLIEAGKKGLAILLSAAFLTAVPGPECCKALAEVVAAPAGAGIPAWAPPFAPAPPELLAGLASLKVATEDQLRPACYRRMWGTSWQSSSYLETRVFGAMTAHFPADFLSRINAALRQAGHKKEADRRRELAELTAVVERAYSASVPEVKAAVQARAKEIALAVKEGSADADEVAAAVDGLWPFASYYPGVVEKEMKLAEDMVRATRTEMTLGAAQRIAAELLDGKTEEGVSGGAENAAPAQYDKGGYLAPARGAKVRAGGDSAPMAQEKVEDIASPKAEAPARPGFFRRLAGAAAEKVAGFYQSRMVERVFRKSVQGFLSRSSLDIQNKDRILAASTSISLKGRVRLANATSEIDAQLILGWGTLSYKEVFGLVRHDSIVVDPVIFRLSPAARSFVVGLDLLKHTGAPLNMEQYVRAFQSDWDVIRPELGTHLPKIFECYPELWSFQIRTEFEKKELKAAVKYIKTISRYLKKGRANLGSLPKLRTSMKYVEDYIRQTPHNPVAKDIVVNDYRLRQDLAMISRHQDPLDYFISGTKVTKDRLQASALWELLDGLLPTDVFKNKRSILKRKFQWGIGNLIGLSALALLIPDDRFMPFSSLVVIIEIVFLIADLLGAASRLMEKKRKA